MKLLIPFVLFLSLPYLFRLMLKKGVKRIRYALLTSFLLALTFFILSILFVNEDQFVIGLVMFVLTFIGSYATQYLLYPPLERYVNSD
jgi:hypothetical protein